MFTSLTPEPFKLNVIAGKPKYIASITIPNASDLKIDGKAKISHCL